MDQLTINRIAHIRQQEIIQQAKHQSKQKTSRRRLILPDLLAFIRRHIGSTTTKPEHIQQDNSTIREGVTQSG